MVKLLAAKIQNKIDSQEDDFKLNDHPYGESIPENELKKKISKSSENNKWNL